MRLLAFAWILFGSAVASANWDLALGPPTSTSAFDKKAVSAVVGRSLPKLRACYGGLGLATVTFTIGADGTVTAVELTGAGERSTACIVSTLTGLRFAKPANGQPVRITYGLNYYDPSATDYQPPHAWPAHSTVPTHTEAEWEAMKKDLEAAELFGHRGLDTPTTSIGELTVKGTIAVPRAYIGRVLGKLADCYEARLRTSPTLAGTVTAELVIGTNGIVVSSKASGMKDVESCVADVIKAVAFPKPSGGEVLVRVPITFHPAHRDSLRSSSLPIQ